MTSGSQLPCLLTWCNRNQPHLFEPQFPHLWNEVMIMSTSWGWRGLSDIMFVPLQTCCGCHRFFPARERPGHVPCLLRDFQISGMCIFNGRVSGQPPTFK